MTDERAHDVRDAAGAFRAARRAGMRGAPDPTSALGIAAMAIGLLVYFASQALPEQGLGFLTSDTVFFILFPLALAAVTGTTGVRETSARLRMRRAWRRAERGEVVQALTGVALREGRTVAGCPVRTVIAHVDGRARFVRLAFARAGDAARLPPGPVRIDLFDGPSVRGPARLRPGHGGVVWAFATRNGDLVVEEETRYTVEDGWPDSGADAEPSPGWPGGSDGDGNDGDGGE
ncbi:hypothetical protein E1295_02155 [Nonomuraea mesophila]|uniref:Uncharacterized protein n=1 Tax=Nonomuraea mesophila TaxID=2530382 RepID=A0A4R5FXW3_9ACTN|nr:hypothetical protein [Nonomuraea mesophila]TDE59714.1 hypothetical protein E1295_02155 [Nonomuraea mesophila]